MILLDALKEKTGRLPLLYEHFELFISTILLVCGSIIISYSLVILIITLYGQLASDIHLFEVAALKDTFGMILGVLIMIEFNHSIALGIRRHSGFIQVRVIVVIAIIVIARKLILLDYASVGQASLLGLGGLALSLGGLYWLLGDADRRRRIVDLPYSPDQLARVTDPPRNE